MNNKYAVKILRRAVIRRRRKVSQNKTKTKKLFLKTICCWFTKHCVKQVIFYCKPIFCSFGCRRFIDQMFITIIWRRFPPINAQVSPVSFVLDTMENNRYWHTNKNSLELLIWCCPIIYWFCFVGERICRIAELSVRTNLIICC